MNLTGVDVYGDAGSTSVSLYLSSPIEFGLSESARLACSSSEGGTGLHAVRKKKFWGVFALMEQTRQ